MNSFKIIQESLSKSLYLIHFNVKKQLYVDLNFNKENDIEAIIYHVEDDWQKNNSYLSKKAVRFIMFFYRLLSSSKTKYWSTELELAKLVWILRKIRHIVKSTNMTIIVFIDHDAAIEIVKQIILFIFSTNRLNLRLIRVSKYIQGFNLKIKHKFEKLHLISDALFRLSTKSQTLDDSESELNVLFIASLVEMTSEFRDRIMTDYVENLIWKKVLKTLKLSKNDEIELSFLYDNDLIYRRKFSHNMSFTFQRLCISLSVIKNILSLIHDENHFEFDKIYQQIISSWYVQDLIKHVKSYIKHCSKCNINQTRHHKSYESLQSILTFSIFFYALAKELQQFLKSLHEILRHELKRCFIN